MKPKFGTDLTVGSIPKHLVTFSLPMLMGSFLQTAYSFINAIWVGKFLGTGALAAVTVSFPVIFVIFGVGMGLTLATNILVSQSFGARNYERLSKVIDSSTILVIGTSIVFATLGWIFSPHILQSMNTPPEVFQESVGYLRIFVLSLPFAFGMFLIRSSLQGIGDSKTPLYFQFGSVILTTVLDPLLIFGVGGLPKLGLNGTAWATLFSQALALVVVIAYLKKRKSPIAPKWPRFTHLGDITWQTIKIGLPTSIQQSLVSIGMVLITGIVNGFGELTTATFGAVSRIDQIAFMPAMTLGMAISTLAGQNLGAGHFDRVKEIFKWGCVFSGGITLVISLIAVSLSRTLLQAFVSDPVVLDMGTHYLHIVGSCYIFFALVFVSNGIINGAGATIITTCVSLLSLWIIRVPLAYYLSSHMESVTGVWYAISLSFFFSMLASMIYYFSGHWRRGVKKRSRQNNETKANPDELFAQHIAET